MIMVVEQLRESQDTQNYQNPNYKMTAKICKMLNQQALLFPIYLLRSVLLVIIPGSIPQSSATHFASWLLDCHPRHSVSSIQARSQKHIGRLQGVVCA